MQYIDFAAEYQPRVCGARVTLSVWNRRNLTCMHMQKRSRMARRLCAAQAQRRSWCGLRNTRHRPAGSVSQRCRNAAAGWRCSEYSLALVLSNADVAARASDCNAALAWDWALAIAWPRVTVPITPLCLLNIARRRFRQAIAHVIRNICAAIIASAHRCISQSSHGSRWRCAERSSAGSAPAIPEPYGPAISIAEDAAQPVVGTMLGAAIYYPVNWRAYDFSS